MALPGSRKRIDGWTIRVRDGIENGFDVLRTVANVKAQHLYLVTFHESRHQRLA
jgi:hypothetical protein